MPFSSSVLTNVFGLKKRKQFLQRASTKNSSRVAVFEEAAEQMRPPRSMSTLVL